MLRSGSRGDGLRIFRDGLSREDCAMRRPVILNDVEYFLRIFAACDDCGSPSSSGNFSGDEFGFHAASTKFGTQRSGVNCCIV